MGESPRLRRGERVCRARPSISLVPGQDALDAVLRLREMGIAGHVTADGGEEEGRTVHVDAAQADVGPLEE